MMANFSPTSAFSSVLLPALGRPNMQTNPEWKDITIGYYTSGPEFSFPLPSILRSKSRSLTQFYRKHSLGMQRASRLGVVSRLASPIAGERSKRPQHRENQKQCAPRNARPPGKERAQRRKDCRRRYSRRPHNCFAHGSRFQHRDFFSLHSKERQMLKQPAQPERITRGIARPSDS